MDAGEPSVECHPTTPSGPHANASTRLRSASPRQASPSSTAFQARFRRTVEAPADLPADCPTARALARQAPPEAGFFQAGTTASAWFPAVAAGEYRDILFIEQAIGLGRFGVLTFLRAEAGGSAGSLDNP